MENKTFFKSVKAVLLALAITISGCLLISLSLNNSVTAEAAVNINSKNITMNVGESKQLKISGAKEKISWSSNKKSIAVINSKGIVTAKNPGTAVITAIFNKNKYTWKITVKNNEVQKIRLNIKSATLFTRTDSSLIDNTYDLYLTAYTTPKSAVNDIIWTSSNQNIATVDNNGHVIAISPGNVIITASCGNKKASCTITVKNSNGSVSGNIMCLTENITSPDSGANIFLIPSNGNAKNMPSLISNSLWDGLLINEHGNKYNVYGTKTDSNGHYSISNVLPGEYMLLILSNHVPSLELTETNLPEKTKNEYVELTKNDFNGYFSEYLNDTNTKYLSLLIDKYAYFHQLHTIGLNMSTTYDYTFYPYFYRDNNK